MRQVWMKSEGMSEEGGRGKGAVIKKNDGPCAASRIIRGPDIIARTPDNLPFSIIITALADVPQPICVRWISAGSLSLAVCVLKLSFVSGNQGANQTYRWHKLRGGAEWERRPVRNRFPEIPKCIKPSAFSPLDPLKPATVTGSRTDKFDRHHTNFDHS